jgi:A/G-specific adenine glycosylase
MNDITNVIKKIISWYIENKRDLPWRKTKNPYVIWVSEIILQQTRVNQGLGYYSRFLEKFPNLATLATAEIDDVLKIWQGLGYYSRARYMHETARYIMQNFKGKFPSDPNDLYKLKGIGRYSAAAIASIAFNKPVPVVDGNVYRLLSRFFGIETPINTSKAYPKFYEIAENLIVGHNPGIFNQALMEFGAVICRYKMPLCLSCPVANDCFANINQKTSYFPVKNKKNKVRSRYFNYFVIEINSRFLFIKRLSNDIWKHLYEFPVVETKDKINTKEVFKEFEKKFHIKLAKKDITKCSDFYFHKLTHQHIYAKFFRLTGEKLITKKEQFKLLEISQFTSVAVPRLIEKYLGDEFGIIK